MMHKNDFDLVFVFVCAGIFASWAGCGMVIGDFLPQVINLGQCAHVLFLPAQVGVEKFITPEMKAQLEEQARLEEERRQAEKGDNARERALDQMMGGVLEVKKEDELRKEIPVPMFMQVGKYLYMYFHTHFGYPCSS